MFFNSQVLEMIDAGLLLSSLAWALTEFIWKVCVRHTLSLVLCIIYTLSRIHGLGFFSPSFLTVDGSYDGLDTLHI